MQLLSMDFVIKTMLNCCVVIFDEKTDFFFYFPTEFHAMFIQYTAIFTRSINFPLCCSMFDSFVSISGD